jgi:protein-tyrosine phosphatase
MEHMDAGAILPMLEVHEDYLVRALDAITASHESVENYLEQALGVGPAQIAELTRRYLE